MPAPFEFHGEEHFDVPPARLFADLTDLDFFAQIIPDLQSSQRVEERTLKCVVRPGFSFLRGTLNLTIALGEMSPPQLAAMQVTADGIGAHLAIDSQLEIAPDATGSRLNWSGTVVELKGLVATISRPLIRAAAEQVIRQSWQNVRTALDEQPKRLS
jgi:carbon monoxide dehydrogenase subunit G